MPLPDPTATADAPLRLGFGCGSLGGELDHKTSCRLVEAAYEAGFRHFDVAPSYGHGRAEGIVGEVLAPVRDTVTIVTKAGISHPKAVSGLRAVRKVFLPIKAAFPSLWKAAAGQANRAVAARGQFGVDVIQASVAESLRRLRTDYVDALLLHEVLPEQVDDDLLSTLQTLRSQQRARAIGTGTSVESTVEIVARHPGAFSWLQMNHYWGAFVPGLRAHDCRLVTHRSLRTGKRLIQSAEFKQALATDASLHALHRALADPGHGPLLLLRAGLLQNAQGRLLVSTTRADRLEQFVVTARDSTVDPLAVQLNEQLTRLSSTLRVTDE
ncbi:aldo/keto reductase [Methylibium sp.]|uniref:aldo/keto reductase n=1 Tax=Methylibium sp. TaxID=2067992 RepID=UPI003D0D926B